jgi:hypothetical protein
MSDRQQSQTGAQRLGDHPTWLLALLALMAWQGWMTLGLFGAVRPWERLLDDEPIVSGLHPLHLYHGSLGARSLRERGALSCFDPSFHAGYPKTPVFDAGSRPAELILAIAGGRHQAAAYKIGHALLCVLVPFLLYTAARGFELVRGAACLSCALGLLVWWGEPCQDALAAGDVDLLLAALMVLAQGGALIRYHHAPGPTSLLAVTLAGLVGWFAHPLLFALLLPLFLVYYLSVGTRHHLPWHLPLWGGLLAALGANAFWLIDWVSYWWIRVPVRLEAPMLLHRTFRTFWEAPLWGGPVDRVFAIVLAGSATIGVVLYNGSCQRATARWLGLGWAGFLILALAGIAYEPASRLGAGQLLVPALLFATISAARALAAIAGGLRQWSGTFLAPLVVLGGALGVAWQLAPEPLGAWAHRLYQPHPLEIGLGEDRAELVEMVKEQTSEEARILWEERTIDRRGSRWTALLPLLTGRAFVGGLGADAEIEHATGGLVDQHLGGKPLRDWADAELEEYCRRYNIGWVVCWSPAVQERFQRWSLAEPGPVLPGEEKGRLFRLRRKASYALVGSVRWRSADARRILLSDAVPARMPDEEEGQVVLSLHYQAGMRVTPNRVRIERAVGPRDPIPFVRLRFSEPVGRIMITWGR